MADSHYSYNGANILQQQGFRTPDKAQRDKNLFHCEFGTSEQQKQRCRLQCIPRTWQGSKQGHGGVFKDCYPQAMGDVSITRMKAPDSKTHLPHTAELHIFLGPRGAAPGTRDRGRRRRWGGTWSTGCSRWNPPERLLGTFSVTCEMQANTTGFHYRGEPAASQESNVERLYGVFILN